MEGTGVARTVVNIVARTISCFEACAALAVVGVERWEIIDADSSIVAVHLARARGAGIMVDAHMVRPFDKACSAVAEVVRRSQRLFLAGGACILACGTLVVRAQIGVDTDASSVVEAERAGAGEAHGRRRVVDAASGRVTLRIARVVRAGVIIDASVVREDEAR